MVEPIRQRITIEKSQWQYWSPLLLWLGVGLTGSMGMAGTMGVFWGWRYVDQRLAPGLADEISQSLNRPVHIGDVEQISLAGLRFGASNIPATAGDRDALTVEAIDIGLSLTDLRQGKLGLAVTLVKPRLFLDQTAQGTWLDTTLELSEDDDIEMTKVRLRDATVVVQPFVPGEPPSKRPQVTLEHVSGVVDLPQPGEPVSFRLRGTSAAGGHLHTQGTIAPDRAIEAAVNLDQMAIAPFSPLFPPGFAIQSGQLDTRLTLQWSPETSISLAGTADLRDLAARVPGEPNPFSETGGHFRFDGQTVWIEQGTTRFGRIPFHVTGRIHLQEGLDLRANVQSVSVPDFMETFDLKLPFAAVGALKTDNLTVSGPFNHVVFAGTVVDAAPVALDRLGFATVRTDFTLDKQSDVLTLFDTEFVPSVGGIVRGGATVQLGDVEGATVVADLTGLPADAVAALYGRAPDGISLGSVNAQTRVQVTETTLRTDCDWQMVAGTYPAQGKFVVENDTLRLQDARVRLPGGTVQARGSLTDGQWQAQLQTDRLWLNTLAPDMAGAVQGAVQLAGNLRSLTPEGIRAAAQIGLSPEVTPLAEPITAFLQWDGDRLQIQDAYSQSARLQGWVDAAFSGPLTPTVTALDLNVRVDDYDLATAPVNWPERLDVRGQTSLSARLHGRLDAPQLVGRVAVQGLNVNAIAFEPNLTGTVQVTAARQGQLELVGARDRIAVSVNQPQEQAAFQIQRGRAMAQGQWERDRLQAAVRDVPLELLATAASVPWEMAAFQGLLSGQVALNLDDADRPEAQADLTIAQLVLGPIAGDQARHQGDRWQGRVQYADGMATLTSGELYFGESHLSMEGQLTPDQPLDWRGNVAVRQGELQDVVTALQWLNQDGNSAAGLLSGFLPSSFADMDPQGRTIGLLETDLDGTFTGTLQARHSSTSDLELAFALDGENWRFGDYHVDLVTLTQGRMQGAALMIPNLEVNGLAYTNPDRAWRSPETQINLEFNSQQRTSRIQVAELPMSAVGAMLDSPVPLNGQMHASARLDHSSVIPQAIGEVRVDEPRINRLHLNPFQIGFGYRDGRVGIGSWSADQSVTPVMMFDPSNTETPALAAGWNGKQLESTWMEPLADRPEADLSQRLVLSYGPFQPSFAIDDLEVFAQTGEMPSGWNFYFNIAGVEPDEMRQMLTQQITIHVGTLDYALHSPLGDSLLTHVAQVVHPRSRQASVQALRSALVLSAHDDHRLSLLEILQNYPTAEVHLDLARLSAMLDQLESLE